MRLYIFCLPTLPNAGPSYRHSVQERLKCYIYIFVMFMSNNYYQIALYLHQRPAATRTYVHTFLHVMCLSEFKNVIAPTILFTVLNCITYHSICLILFQILSFHLIL